MDKVSVIIPGRCEQYFQQTIDSVLASATGDVEVIAIVDGYEPDPPLIAKDSRVKLIKLEKSIGQRAAYNLGVRESTGKYVIEDLRSGSYLKRLKRPKDVPRTTDVLKKYVDDIHQKAEIRCMSHYYDICFLEKL